MKVARDERKAEGERREGKRMAETGLGNRQSLSLLRSSFAFRWQDKKSKEAREAERLRRDKREADRGTQKK